MDKFKGKYLISSHRYKNADYTEEGSYFITFNTKNQAYYFGSVHNGKMLLNQQGYLLKSLITEIHERFPYVELNAFVIMPNHIHLLLSIYQSDSNNNIEPMNKKEFMNKEGIPKIIRWLKARYSYEVKKFNPYFSWQPNYHDHIIRDKDSFIRIQNYIEHNPEKWEEDKFYIKGKKGIQL